VGAAAPASCRPPVGANYIAFDFAHPEAANLPSGQDLAATFTCMASVGSMGCGFEHQLESVYAALRGSCRVADGNGCIPENTGFLRGEDALLVVVFVTNEDDSSTPVDSDIFDVHNVAEWGYLSTYRQTRFGVACCPPGESACTPDELQLTPYGDSMGPLAGCVPAPDPGGAGPGREYDVSRYIDFFTRPRAQGGVKDDPTDGVVLVAIDAPESPVEVILSDPNTPGGQPYQQCPRLDEVDSPACVPVLQHSCMNPDKPAFFGDPSVRLNTVVRAAGHGAVSSICANDYSGALRGIADLVSAVIDSGCIPGKLPTDADGNPVADCVVEDVTRDPAGGPPLTTELPRCDHVGGATPCWRLEAQPSCTCPPGGGDCAGTSPDGLGITVERGGVPAPAHTTARMSCATLP
jgi:hypothetical protein